MKINLITPSLPHPVDRDGTSIIVSNYATQLSKKHEVSITYIDKDIVDLIEQKEAIKYWKDLGIELRIFDIKDKKSSIMTPLPKSCFKLGRLRDISIWDKTAEYQIIFRADLILALSALEIPVQSKLIYFPIDLFSKLYGSYYKNERSVIKKLYYLTQNVLWKAWEKELFKGDIFTFFVSGTDAEEMKLSVENSNKIITTKNGTSLELEFELPTKKCIQHDTVKIGFSGDFSYKPNKQGVELLIRSILPNLKLNNITSIEFILIGRNPHIKVGTHKLKNGITLVVTGEVDNILNEISQLDLYVSPLVTGAGMKNKILSVMASGVPFCATATSVEGIDELIDGKNFVLLPENETLNWPALIRKAYDNKQFLMCSPDLNRQLITSLYSWSSVVSFFEDVALNDRK